MHLLQPFADQPERITKALFERRMQFLIDRQADAFQLLGVVALNGGQPCFNRLAQLLETLLVALRQTVQRARLFLAVTTRRNGGFLSCACHLLPQLTLYTRQRLRQGTEIRVKRRTHILALPATLPQQELQQEQQRTQQQQAVKPDFTHEMLRRSFTSARNPPGFP